MANAAITSHLRSVTAALHVGLGHGGNSIHSMSFHVMKLPAVGADAGDLRRIIVEWVISPTDPYRIWWTSYVFFTRRGALARGTGVYSDWSEFGISSEQAPKMINIRAEGINIVDIANGVLLEYHAFVRDVPLSGSLGDHEIFACLVTTGRVDEIHAQARLEYRTRDDNSSVVIRNDLLGGW